jgi:chitinase
LATPYYEFEQSESYKYQKNIVLSFIVASKKDPCIASWGGIYSTEQANRELDLDRRLARYRQQGGEVAISFGGQLNDELAVSCKDQDLLTTAYEEIINHYQIDTIDLDIEGSAISDKESIIRRAKAISTLQKRFSSSGNKHLAVWLTLPVSPQGLTQEGADLVKMTIKEGVDLSGINVMTMDYGGSKDKSQTMAQASIDALNETHRQLSIIYSQSNINLSSQSIWRKIGATPMIGQNDVNEEVFTLQDAKELNQFLIKNGVSRVSMWSANRDIECGENYVNVSVVSTSCSGIKQDKFGFAIILRENFDGNISSNSQTKTKPDPVEAIPTDNPKESPYQIWSESAIYLEGTKVVWKHNVYQAKWWTKGDLPDNPVLQSYQTPWKLIGPVLAGETPIPQQTLPPGTYPKWSGTETYDAGQRILFNGIPYQAKWWTQGDSPAAATSNPDASPWAQLTKDELNRIFFTACTTDASDCDLTS